MSRGFYNTPGAQFLYTAPDSGGPGGLGMDCLLRSPSTNGPFHYLINEHSKSLIALQELQHEVGALLEFRDLVIETFPNLKTKMAASSTPSTMTSHPSAIPVTVRREWEPGIRVRRKLQHKDDSSYSRSRSNSHSSHSSKNQPKSGDAVSVVQDSGFSTETSSSKETPSASAASTTTKEIDEAEDELWNLLDVIHRKGTRLKDEVEALQGMLHEQNMEQNPQCDFQRSLLHASVDDVRTLRRERDVLLDRVAEMEAETLAGRVHTARLQSDLENLLATKHDLEEQLRTVISQKSELNNRIHDMHLQFISNNKTSSQNATSSSPVNENSSNSNPKEFGKLSKNTSQKAVVRRSSSRSSIDSLESIMGGRVPKVKEPDSKRIAAILLEHDPIILQRHLLSTTVQNQLLQQRLEMIIRTKNQITEKLDKAKEENDDLRFQLEDRNIELEGTRARVRLLEQLQLNNNKPLDQSPDIIPTTLLDSNLLLDPINRPLSRSEITTSSMKNMSPLPLNLLQMDHSSSTESAHDQSEQRKEHRRRPSKIPLPGIKSYAAPKPPIGNKSPNTRSRSGGSPGRSNSASWRNKSEANSLSGSKSNNSLNNKSRNGSLTVRNSRDSLSGKVRSNDSLSKLRDNSVNSPSKNVQKTPGTPVRRLSSSATSRTDQSPDKITTKHSSWIPTSYGSETDLCPDSLDPIKHSQPLQTMGTFATSSSGSQVYQTANTFFWNTSPTSEYFDSIDSMSLNLNNCSLMDSSLYQQNGEGLAEFDSLEKNNQNDIEKKFNDNTFDKVE